MRDSRPELVEAGAEFVEDQGRLGMADRLAGIVRQQVLLRDIGHIARLIILGQKVIEGLVFPWAHGLWDRLPPFLGVGENRVHIENNATERKNPVLHDLTYGEFREPSLHDPQFRAVVLNR